MKLIFIGTVITISFLTITGFSSLPLMRNTMTVQHQPMHTPGYKPTAEEIAQIKAYRADQALKRKVRVICEYEAKKSVANQHWQPMSDAIMTNLRMKEVYDLCIKAKEAEFSSQ